MIDGYAIVYLNGKALRSVLYGAMEWSCVARRTEVVARSCAVCTAFLNARSRRTVGCVFEP